MATPDPSHICHLRHKTELQLKGQRLRADPFMFLRFNLKDSNSTEFAAGFL